MPEQMEQFDLVFNKCPACGSTERFFETLANQLKERGLARPEWIMCMDAKTGIVVDKAKEAAIPIGSEISSYLMQTDICINCGCVYTIKLATSLAKKVVTPAKPIVIPPGSHN